MDGFGELYAVIANATEKPEDIFFTGKVTAVEPVRVEAFGLPLTGAVFVRGLPEMTAGDTVLGVLIDGNAYVIAVI